jgi:hypothetical protein
MDCTTCDPQEAGDGISDPPPAEMHEESTTMSPQEAEIRDRIHAWFGTITLGAASIFAVLIFSDRMDMEFVDFPAVWYSSRQLHLVLCGAMLIAAAVLLKSPAAAVRQYSRPLFQSCRLLTREQCHLCDDARAVLMTFQYALPPIEIVDIDDNPQLIRQFGESVPVVEINGRVRFRGAVQPALLRRMIDAAELRQDQRQDYRVAQKTGTVEDRSHQS